MAVHPGPLPEERERCLLPWAESAYPLLGEKAGGKAGSSRFHSLRSSEPFGSLRLPEGGSRIAQQFTAGLGLAIACVPEGRLNPPNLLRQLVFSLCVHEKESLTISG